MSDLKDKLESLGQAELIDLVLTLHHRYPGVADDIEFLAERHNPEAQAKQLKKRVQSISRGSKFIDYRSSAEFGRQLDALHDDILELVMAGSATGTAFDLIDLFMQGHEKLLNRIDDSGGWVGDTYRYAVLSWLKAARMARDDPKCKVGRPRKLAAKLDWQERVYEIFSANDYGIWDPLLPNCHELLTTEEIQQLAWRFEGEAKSAQTRTVEGRYNQAEARACIGLAGVAEALGDVAMYEKSTLIHSPEPNELQRLSLANYCLSAGEPNRALHWLQAPMSERSQNDQRRLIDASYQALGDTSALRKLRREAYDGLPNHHNYTALLEVSSEAEREQLQAEAVTRANDLPYLHDAVATLKALNEPAAAARLLVSRYDELDGRAYNIMPGWAKYFEDESEPLAAILCLRALLDNILAEARSTAYGHAARYMKALERLAGQCNDYAGVVDHAAYVERVREQHFRKQAFWRRLEK